MADGNEPALVSGLILAYEGFDPAQEGVREALTSTGNGYFCARGAAEWENADDVHYPGTYSHGVYNRETTIRGGRPVLNEDLVNLPNWLVLQVRIEGDDALRLADVEVLSYRHELDVASGVVQREVRCRDQAGRRTALRSRRFVSLADAHHAGVEWTLTPENWSGRVEIVSAIDGRVTNSGVARYGELEGRHLNPVGPRTFGPEVIGLKVQTRQSNVYVSQAARTRVFDGERHCDVQRSLYQMEDYVQQVLMVDVHEGAPVRVEKMVSFFTSRDPATSDTLIKAGRTARRYLNFEAALERHTSAWQEVWRGCDVEVSCDERVQLLLRLHVNHLVQVCSRHTVDLDAGVPARGLNGEAYRGHVFWDELFVLPFLSVRVPEVARALLMYRYRRLGEAAASAREAGFKGAMFPWQSGSEGVEESQEVHLNPVSGRWDPDLSRIQRHVNAAIFYNIWHYYQATGDLAFLRDYGAQMMLEITRFWASIAHFNATRQRYEIHGVMGPDEFHEKYSGASEGGLNNNAYTNVMVAWLCGIASEVLALLPTTRAEALRQELQLQDEEVRVWQDMADRMFVPFHDGGIISQFEGYEKLQELDWGHYRERYGNIQRLDRILRAEGKDPNDYKVTKQSDVVMLFFLFTEEELRSLFARLGYDYDPTTASDNIAYYDRRTSHGSTLSVLTHAGALARIEPGSSWQRFLVALESDVADIQGGTTKEGIHLGVMAGTVDLVQHAYAGVFPREGVLHFSPCLPEELKRVSFAMKFRGTPVEVSVTHDELTLSTRAEGESQPIRIGFGNAVHQLLAGESRAFPIAALDDEKQEQH